MIKVGLLVNPIAGMGAALGLKGTDYYPKELFVYPGPAFKKGVLLLKEFYKLYSSEKENIEKVEFIVPNGYMGENLFHEINNSLDFHVVEVYDKTPTSSEHTKLAVRMIKEFDPTTIFFVGGDGTAYDIARETRSTIPIVGVPAGTKVYSSVFVTSIFAASKLLFYHLKGETILTETEVMLVDEKALEMDVFKIIDILQTTTIEHKYTSLHQLSKDFTNYGDEQDNIEEIAQFFKEEVYQSDKLYVFGPGITVMKIVEKMGFKKPLFAFTAIKGKKLFCHACDANSLYNLINNNIENTRIVLSPLGNTGFIIGRGTGVLTKSVLSFISIKNLIIVATRRKASKIKKLLVDTGDIRLNKKFTGYVKVITGYNEYMVKKITGIF